MYQADWIKELNESYISNIRNPVSISEEQMLIEDTKLVHLSILVESIEETYDIELTEEEIVEIYQKLNEEGGVGETLLTAAALVAGATLGKGILKPRILSAARKMGIDATRLRDLPKAGALAASEKAIKTHGGLKPIAGKVAKTLEKAGSKTDDALKASNKAAVQKASQEAAEKHQKALKSWEKARDDAFKAGKEFDEPIPVLGKPTPKFQKASGLTKMRRDATASLKSYSKKGTAKTAKTAAKVGAGAGLVAGGLGLTGGVAGLLSALSGSGSKSGVSQGTSQSTEDQADVDYALFNKPAKPATVRGEYTGGNVSQSDRESAMKRMMGIREYVSCTTSSAVDIVESMYDVKLNEEQVAFLAYNIGKRFV